MREELNILIKAQYPLIYLVTPEEKRAEQAIAGIVQAEKSHHKVLTWTLTQGLRELGQQSKSSHNPTANPIQAIEAAINEKDPAIFIFKDLHAAFTAAGGAEVVRLLRDAIHAFKGTSKNIILVSPIQSIPVELESDIVVLDFPLPTMGELDELLSAHIPAGSPKLMPEVREKLLRASLGLSYDEAEKVYQKAKVTTGRLSELELDIILSEKKQLIRRNGILEFIEEDETIDSVGGLEELKRWLKQRNYAFTERAREYGLPEPKGMLILGVPGCGKSLIAKTTSRLWGLPLLRLDIGRVYDGSTVGRSEANLRSALKTAESIAPAILFIDEMDKAFAGSSGSADSDGGTSSRIFGSFLTWMQEKTSSVFVMATANRVERLPGEFLRKGRFDEIFFVDLPTKEEREEIFKVHLSKRRCDTSRFDIEQAIVAAMYEAFAQDREFTQLDIIAASRATMPLSRTMAEQVTALRDWARQRARPAAASVAEYQRLEF